MEVEYAKATIDDILVRLTVANRGPEAAALHVLPTLWFRNTWAWEAGAARPRLSAGAGHGGLDLGAGASIATLGTYHLYGEGTPELLFTENETNRRRLFNAENVGPFVKDAFHAYVVHGQAGAVNPAREGTKAAAHYRLTLAPGETATLRLRLTDREAAGAPPGADFEAVFARRRAEADAFYATVIPPGLERRRPDGACGRPWPGSCGRSSGITTTSSGGSGAIPPSHRRRPGARSGRNHAWTHLYNEDVVSVPDKWEYPWYASWDLAFHAVALALVDPDYAKDQLILFTPRVVHAPRRADPGLRVGLRRRESARAPWAALRVYEIEKAACGQGDVAFLKRVFHKLLLTFTWWVNRKDPDNKNVFEGGFLGLDNIGIFDRSAPLPTGGTMEQSDGTAWVAMFCLTMLHIAATLALEDPVYEDIASKFFEHFVYISQRHERHGR